MLPINYDGPNLDEVHTDRLIALYDEYRPRDGHSTACSPFLQMILDIVIERESLPPSTCYSTCDNAALRALIHDR